MLLRALATPLVPTIIYIHRQNINYDNMDKIPAACMCNIVHDIHIADIHIAATIERVICTYHAMYHSCLCSPFL